MATVKTGLSRKLLTRVLSVYFILTLIVTVGQIFTEYLSTKNHIESELRTLKNTFAESLTRANWELNKVQARIIAEGLTKLPTIEGVQVRDENGDLVADEGQTIPSNGSPVQTGIMQDHPGGIFSYSFPLIFEFSGRESFVGDVTLYSSFDIILSRIEVGIFFLIGNAIVKTAFLIFLFMTAFKHMLSEPLAELTGQMTTFDPEHPEDSKIQVTDGEDNELRMLQQSFNQVIDDFVDSYARGETPNPCVRCNERIKFSALASRALALGFDALATGHYARLSQGRLRRAVDRHKDQTYFLFQLDQSQLSRILFPLGELTKEEVRQRARGLGLKTADKPESQDKTSEKRVPNARRKPIVKGGAASDKYIRAATQGGADRTYQEIPVEQISESRIRDRIDVNEDIESLAESIRDSGQQIPILVRVVQGEMPYEIVVGRRRLAAVRRLGHTRIKAFVSKIDEREAFIAQGIENTERLETSYIERARAASQAVGLGYEAKTWRADVKAGASQPVPDVEEHLLQVGGIGERAVLDVRPDWLPFGRTEVELGLGGDHGVESEGPAPLDLCGEHPAR